MDNEPANEVFTDDYKMQTEDLRLLDLHAEEAQKQTIYSNNRPLFLLQSTLLGLSYAMIWPTVWTYIRDEFSMDPNLTKLLYGLTYIAYPVASMISAHAVERIKLKTKTLILLLNLLEIIGSLVYTLSYYPFLPLIGRFIAGLGDAFYVVLMKEMKNRYGVASNEKMTIECLAAFIVGVIIAPGVNIITTFLHFHLQHWNLNSNNFPGLTMAVLFLLMEFIILFFMSPQTNNTQSKSSSESSSRFFDSGEHVKFSTYKTTIIAVTSLFYTYTVASFELMIPLILYQIMKADAIGAMLLYAVIGTLYAISLMITMTTTFKHQLETFLGISIVAQVAGLFVLLYVYNSDGPNAFTIICVVVLVFCLITMWSNDDVLFINYVQVFIPPSLRESTHNSRKVVSKLAFAVAGVSVPFWFSSAMFVVAPILIVAVLFLFIVFVIIRMYEHKK